MMCTFVLQCHSQMMKDFKFISYRMFICLLGCWMNVHINNNYFNFMEQSEVFERL